jgi:hypothetical protein
VGSPLYEIDTDATAVKAAEKEPSAKTAVETSPPPTNAPTPPMSPPESLDASERTPSINFLGKQGWAARLSGDSSNAEPESKQIVVTAAPAQQTSILVDLPPMYGRLKFTEEEIEALISGGASAAPVLKKASNKF